MPEPALVQLVSTVTRLLHPRSTTPRHVALGSSYRLIARFASERGLSEEWCDRVLRLLLVEQHASLAA